MDCFQPIPKPEITDVIVETAAKYFGIEDDKEICNLKFFFNFYADVRMKDAFIKAFSKPDCEKN